MNIFNIIKQKWSDIIGKYTEIKYYIKCDNIKTTLNFSKIFLKGVIIHKKGKRLTLEIDGECKNYITSNKIKLTLEFETKTVAILYGVIKLNNIIYLDKFDIIQPQNVKAIIQ